MLIGLIVLLLFINAHTVKTENVQAKSSLTFVIDDTGSMYDDIEAVKREANSIYNTVLISEESQIEDFVIVTFNDPFTNVRTKTRDHYLFKNALNNISVNGGDDCPEMALEGIIEALKQSKHGSTLYVFTDASAKDYMKSDRVRRLSQQKECQVVFILTGMCPEDQNHRRHLVYKEIAEATNGQVFNLYKDDVSTIFNYVKENIKGKKVPIVNKVFNSGYEKKVDFVIDDKMKDVTVAVTGDSPESSIVGPAGHKLVTTNIVHTNDIKIVKITDTKPGVHTANVGSKSSTTVVVSGRTDFNFEHGFSVIEPTTMVETSKQPLIDIPSILAVQTSSGGKSVDLDTVEILDMDDNLIRRVDLKLIDEDIRFYRSQTFIPPNMLFKIAVNGYDNEGKSRIRRMSTTPVEPQKITESDMLGEKPMVKIIEGAMRNIDYGSSKSLTCFVQGYPAPNILWMDESGTELDAQISLIELPNKYGSYLKLKNVIKDAKYTCTATNNKGSDIKTIQMKVIRYFKIKERPIDKSIEFSKDDRLICKIDAKPAVTIRWYHNGTLIKNNDHYRLSLRDSVLNIRNMSLQHVGQYECEAENVFEKKIFTVNIFISGLVPANIVTNNTNVTIEVFYNRSTILTCKVMGKPEPRVVWEDGNGITLPGTIERGVLENEYISYFNISNVKEDLNFSCIATNYCGLDKMHISIKVKRYFKVLTIPPEVKQIEVESDDNLTCAVMAEPRALITWYHNGEIINGTHNNNMFTVSPDRSTITIKNMSPEHMGNYSCVTANPFETKSFNTTVQIVGLVAPRVVPFVLTVAKFGSGIELHCSVLEAKPKPKITWFSATFLDEPLEEMNLTTRPWRIANIQSNDSGKYVGVAENIAGKDYCFNRVIVVSDTYPNKYFENILTYFKYYFGTPTYLLWNSYIHRYLQ